jgi:RDD family protein
MSEFRTVRELRRDALGQDTLLFCLAFTIGAAAYAIVRAVADGLVDYWTIGLSDGLLLSGLVAGELFLLWNNGYRQGVRGHSIGKHRCGIAVVDRGDDAPTGVVRGLVRGLIMVVLLDLSAAAIPIGLPTVLREVTPDSWHIGAATYIALIVILVPLLLPTDRGLADWLLRTKVVRGTGVDATTRPGRRRALVALDVIGLLGVAAVAITYVAFYWPLIWQFPGLS